MAAFDKINSGFPQMDEILDYIRLGDNVVWQVSDIEEFRYFAGPFARQAVSDGRNVIYIRFAQHEPVLSDLTGIKVYHFNPDEGFEAFTVSIHEQITREGRDAFYIFDCLSELQSVWYTDLMMGNFFQVTCPYLFELDTVAYFPLLRGRHSFDAVARIRDTTQLLLDVYSGDTDLYLHPLKVWNRYSSRMFLPHCCRKTDGSFTAAADGVSMSRYYQTIQRSSANAPDQNYDSHDRFFVQAKLDYSRGYFTEETEDLIIDSTMTKDGRLKALVKRYFKPEDYFMLRDRMIGSGAIGGKACGMLLARKIAESEIPEFLSYSEPHDSFYIGSDVFYTYIVSNGCWRLRIRQRTREEYFSAAKELKERLSFGEFPGKIREQFQNVIEYFGQSPFIVRSSSFLEDGFGNAFAGKYESVFCVNQGSPQKRLAEFEQAVRTVYASTMDYSALEYRLLRGLEKQDEQMAVLVQRVSGSYYGSYFMPGAAGVGYSHSAYQWLPNMDARAGMLRIVMGLGTRAVDRTQQDYPRLANLDRPAATVYTTPAQKHKYSQRHIDVLDCERNCLRDVLLGELLPVLPPWYKDLVLERDFEAEQTLRNLGRPAVEGGDSTVGEAHSLHLIPHLHQLLPGGEGELRLLLPKLELKMEDARRGLRRDAGLMALCRLPASIRRYKALPGEDTALCLTDPAAQELEVQQLKHFVRQPIQLCQEAVFRIEPAQRGVICGLGHHMAVLGLLGQGNEGVRLHKPAVLQPDQSLKGGALLFTQASQTLRQGVERWEILSGLEGGE